MCDGKQALRNGLTYADAGVDITAGNDLVSAIKPLAKSTRRKGANAALGGFGGLFDLKACGFRDPVLVAANDGVGTKLKVAIDAVRGKRDEKAIASLFTFGGTTQPGAGFRGDEAFEVVTYLVVLPCLKP